MNLAPADMRKSGVAFDLAIALALLATDEQVGHESLRDYVHVFDNRVTEKTNEVAGTLDHRLARFQEAFDSRTQTVTQSLRSTRRSPGLSNRLMHRSSDWRPAITFPWSICLELEISRPR